MKFRIESRVITSRIQGIPALAVILLLLLTISGCGGGGGSDATPVAADLTPPTVEYFYPDPAKGNIYPSEIQANGIYVIFTEPVKDTTITGSNFTVTDNTSGGAPVNGAVSFEAATRTARFVPTNPLTALFTYTASVTTGVQDLAGNNLASPYTWQFTIAGPTAPPPPPLP